VLIAPDRRRLMNLFILNRPAGASHERRIARHHMARRIAYAAQVAVGALLVWSNWSSLHRQSFGVVARPPLYGIWNVETMTIDGVVRAPLITDNDRWRRVVVQTQGAVSFQRMDDTFWNAGATIDAETKTIALTMGARNPENLAGNRTPSGQLTFEQPSPDRL